MPRAEARGGMATGDRAVARRARAAQALAPREGGLAHAAQAPALRVGAVPLGFTTDAPRGSAGSFTFKF